MPSQSVKELQELNGQLYSEIRELSDKADAADFDWTEEVEGRWKELNAEYDRRGQAIDRQKRIESLQGELDERDDGATMAVQARRDSDKDRWLRRQDPSHVTEEDRSIAIQAWCLTQCGKKLTQRQQEASDRLGIDPREQEFEVNLRNDPWNVRAEFNKSREHRMTTSATAGGEFIPEGFVNALEVSLLAFGGMRQVADVIRTTTGNDLPWPTTNDTGNSGQLLAEAGTVSEQDVATSSVVFGAYKYSSDLVRVSAELMTDSAFNLVSVLGQMLGERIARILNSHFTTGDGSSKPKGIVPASGLGVTAAATTAVTFDELIDLVHSVDPAYRSGAFNTGFMMNDGVAQYVRKLKDGDDNYLWQRDNQTGQADTLLGFPVTINQNMQATLAAAEKTVIFGALNKYKIRDVAGIRLRRLVELYAASDQEGFVAFSRHDGDLLDSGTDPVKHIIQAAS